MEIFEIRYFVAVAQTENIHQASERLKVSPASLSKAISRIEAEMDCKLFDRVGRQIKLTAAGRLLWDRGGQILEWEADIKKQLKGKEGELHVRMGGPEVLLTRYGRDLASRISKRYPSSHFDFLAMSEKEAFRALDQREIHFAFGTSEIPGQFQSRVLEEARFVTVAGKKHLLAKGKKSAPLPVEELLQHPFVSPSSALLGKVQDKQSLDGWRDDKFPRKIHFKSESLKMIEELVTSGEALAYLPDYLAKDHLVRGEWEVLKVSGCPYTCEQKIRLLTKAPLELGWIRQVF
jgi:DNA-binding transcriptional LysR family regulator